MDISTIPTDGDFIKKAREKYKSIKESKIEEKYKILELIAECNIKIKNLDAEIHLIKKMF